jgi:hypothetical protein
MPSIQTVASRIRDPVALAAACRRLGLPEPMHKTITLCGVSITGSILPFPGCSNPVVIDLATGLISYCGTEDSPLALQHLSKLLQAYACEKAYMEALSRGHSISERKLEDGSIIISIKPGGAK